VDTVIVTSPTSVVRLERLHADVTQRDAHGHEDDGELADLRHGQPGQEAGALAVAHVAHDRHDDQRIADQHEERQHHRRPDLTAERREVELGAEVDEEEQQQEVADAGQPRVHRLAVGGGGQREAGQEGARLLAEARPLAQRRRAPRPRRWQRPAAAPASAPSRPPPPAAPSASARTGRAAAASKTPAQRQHHRQPACVAARSPAVPRRALMAIMAMTTARSCTIRKPTAMRPCRLSSSRLSDSSLTMMMVLENVSATATYSASIRPLPSARIKREADHDGEG
jgi:hypothetical protein